MTPELVKLLKKAIGKDKSTFIKDRDQLYVRYDSLTIQALEKEGKRGIFGAKKYDPNRFVIKFQLNGETVHVQELRQFISMANGDSLTLQKLNGLFPIDLTE